MIDRFATYLAIIILALAALYYWAGVQILRKRIEDANAIIKEMEFLHGLRARSEGRTLVKVREMSEANKRLERALVGNFYSVQRNGFGRN